MPKYYHISNKRIKNLINGRPLYLDKKGGRFNNMWKSISEDDCENYIEYSINIPNYMFTEEIKSGTNKILRITKNNKRQFKKIQDKLASHTAINNFLQTNDYIGLDMLELRIKTYSWIYRNELIILNFDRLNKLEIEEIVKFK